MFGLDDLAISPFVRHNTMLDYFERCRDHLKTGIPVGFHLCPFAIREQLEKFFIRKAILNDLLWKIGEILIAFSF